MIAPLHFIFRNLNFNFCGNVSPYLNHALNTIFATLIPYLVPSPTYAFQTKRNTHLPEIPM